MQALTIVRVDGDKVINAERPHPLHKNCTIVFATWGDQYVTWIYNQTFKDYVHGHYHGTNLKAAIQDYYNR